MAGFDRIGQILDVQIDLEAGLEVAGQDHRRFRFHDGAAGQTAANGVEHQLGIDAGFSGQNKGFGHGGDVQGDDDLVRQFGRVAGADVTAQHHRFPHLRQQFRGTVEQFFFAADHDRQAAVDRLGLAAADRRIEHLDPFLRHRRSNFLRGQRGDRAHVDQNQTRFGAFENSVRAKDRRLHMRRVRQHGDDDFGLRGHVFGSRRRFGPGRHHFVHRILVDVEYDQFIPCLEQILGHGFPHDSQADKTNFFHLNPPPTQLINDGLF